MLYQLNDLMVLILVVLDAVILFLLYLLIRLRHRLDRILLYILALLLTLGSSFFKLLLSDPAATASSPGDILIENNTGHSFQTFYYLREDSEEQPYAFWREYVFGLRKVRTLEIEGMRSLLVAKKIDGEWRYQHLSSTSRLLRLDNARFQPDASGRITQAVHARQWVELGTYFSELLTLAVLFLLIRRLPTLRHGFRAAGSSAVAVA